MHVLCSVMDFDDGSVQVIELHRGTEKECREFARGVSAIRNFTDKKCIRSVLAMPTLEQFEEVYPDGIQADKHVTHSEAVMEAF